MKNIMTAAASICCTLILVATTGCTPTKQEQERQAKMETRLDEIQAQLMNLSEQMHTVQVDPAQEQAPFQDELALRPIVPVEEAPAVSTERPSSKKERLRNLATNTKVVTSKKSSSRSSKSRGSSLTRKHIRVNASVRQIQSALRNAGTNPGAVDGRLGKKTIAAIKEFQTQQGLKADGIVGSKTWAILSSFNYAQK